MAALVVEGVNEQLVTMYAQASQEAKQQFNKVLEDVLQLWTERRGEVAQDHALWQEVLEFGLNHPTFPLDWEHHKLTREEMNEG